MDDVYTLETLRESVYFQRDAATMQGFTIAELIHLGNKDVLVISKGKLESHGIELRVVE